VLCQRAQRRHETANSARPGVTCSVPLVTENWRSTAAAFCLQARIIALIPLSPAHPGGSPPLLPPSPLADPTRPRPWAPVNATGPEAAAGTPPRLSTRQPRGVAPGAEKGGGGGVTLFFDVLRPRVGRRPQGRFVKFLRGGGIRGQSTGRTAVWELAR